MSLLMALFFHFWISYIYAFLKTIKTTAKGGCMNNNNDQLQVKIPNKIICNSKSSTSIARTVNIVRFKLCENLSMHGWQGTSLCFPTGRKDRYRNHFFEMWMIIRQVKSEWHMLTRSLRNWKYIAPFQRYLNIFRMLINMIKNEFYI